MSPVSLDLIENAATARLALSPLRREILRGLQTPASAAQLARTLGVSRQKLGHHMRLLEAAGLIEVVETRARRGFTEKLYRARAGALVMDPSILAATDPDATAKQDEHAAEHLVRAASALVRDVARMRGEAEREGTRLLTFTIEAEVRFGKPSDIDAFASRLTRAVAEIAGEFAPADGMSGRPYRLVIGGHPAPEVAPKPAIN